MDEKPREDVCLSVLHRTRVKPGNNKKRVVGRRTRRVSYGGNGARGADR